MKASDLKLGAVLLLWDPFANTNEWWMVIKIENLSSQRDSSFQITVLSEKGDVTVGAQLSSNYQFSNDYQIIC
jgi:hypothetical protein